MTIINFTINGKNIPVDVGSAQKVNFTFHQQAEDGTKLPDVTFTAQVTPGIYKFNQAHQGTLIGNDPFTMTITGNWSRQGDSYLWGNAPITAPLNYNLPNQQNDGKPSFKICVGSDYYSQFYSSRGSSSYIPGAIMNAADKYLIPTSFDISRGGNDPSCFAAGIDGRSYCAILNNYYNNNSGQAPMLFYQDKGSSEWCQYFFPFDPSFGTISGAGSVWSGSFHIFKQDMTISGHAFKRGNVIYLYGIPGNSAWTPTVFGVKTPQANTCIHFWAMADTIDAAPLIGGVVRYGQGEGGAGDPRLFFEDGNLWYGTNAPASTPHGYEVYRVNALKQGDVGDITRIASWTPNFSAAPLPAGAFGNSECGAPVKMNGFNLMGFSTQIVNANGKWNTLKNNNKLVRCDRNWNADLSTISTIDIGYDSYAIALSSDNPEDANCKTGKCGSTLMNWGSMNMAYYGTKPGLPWLPFSINDNGAMKFVPDNFTDAGFTSLPIYINNNTETITGIIDKGGLIVDYADTLLNYFAWKLTNPVPAPDVLNDPAPYGAIQKIYYRQNGALLTILIQTDDTHNDILATFWNIKGQLMKPSTIYIPSIDNSAADKYNSDFAANHADIYIQNGTNISNGWTNDDFGYMEMSDGTKFSAVLSGSLQHNYFFKSLSVAQNWLPYMQYQPFNPVPTWNGGFVAIREADTISGYQFAVDDIAMSVCSGAGSAQVAFFKYANGDIANDGTYLKPFKVMGCPLNMNDPRITIDHNTKRFRLTWVNNPSARGYSTAEIIDVNAGTLTPIQTITPNYGPYTVNRDECSSPIYLNGMSFFSFSLQQSSSQGLEGDFIVRLKDDWSAFDGSPWALNIGKYNYAASVSNFGVYNTHTIIDANGRPISNTGYRAMYTVSNFNWKRGGNAPQAIGTFIEVFLNGGYIDYIIPANAVKTTQTMSPGQKITAGYWAINNAAGGTVETWTWQQGSTYEWNVIRQVKADGSLNGASTVYTRKLSGIGS